MGTTRKKRWRPTPGKSQCQYSVECKNEPLEGKPFCKKHIKYPIKSTLTGYEPVYNPDIYNKIFGIKESHNCFAYAFGEHQLKIHKKGCTKESCDIPFVQPGMASGYPKWSKVNGKRCPDLIARLLGDVPDLKLSTFENQCPNKMRKIALVVDPKEDYHFYRQDSDGYYSHKPGGTDVIRTDATGRPIFNPELASRDYPKKGLNYGDFCSYLCIPADKSHNLKSDRQHVIYSTVKTKPHMNKPHMNKPHMNKPHMNATGWKRQYNRRTKRRDRLY
jgi:hypothetical protein